MTGKPKSESGLLYPGYTGITCEPESVHRHDL